MLKHRPTFLQNALLLSKTTAENCFLKKKHLCNHALAQTCKNSISLILNVGSFLKHPLLNCNARLGTDRSSCLLQTSLCIGSAVQLHFEKAHFSFDKQGISWMFPLFSII